MTTLSLGRSIEGRPLEAVRLGPTSGAVRLLVFGAIHGDEADSAELCRRYVAQLAGQPPAAPVIIWPVVNPDGLARLHKDNARGVDLNRNFPARNWAAAHPPGYHPGAVPLSEPEAAALAALIEQARPQRIVAVHQPFRCVNWDGPAAALAARMSAACGYPARAAVGYPTPGSFGSRYGVDEQLEVITLEMPRPAADADHRACLAALECARLD